MNRMEVIAQIINRTDRHGWIRDDHAQSIGITWNESQLIVMWSAPLTRRDAQIIVEYHPELETGCIHVRPLDDSLSKWWSSVSETTLDYAIDYVASINGWPLTKNGGEP